MAADIPDRIAQATRVVGQADALLIAAGAGMGVDSGLPDFRETQGFWRACPVIAKSGLSFEQSVTGKIVSAGQTCPDRAALDYQSISS